MKKFFSSLLFLCSLNLSAQITLTADDFPQIGETIATVNGVASSTLSVGNAGANQTYDFSTIESVDTSTFDLISPVGTPGAAAYPNATMAWESDGDYFYFETTSDAIFQLGGIIDTSEMSIGQYTLFPFSPPSKIFEIPSTYNTSYTDNWGFSITVEDDSGFADSIRSTTLEERQVLFDGYGTVITPDGSYEGLRERVYATGTITTEIYALGMWTTVFTQTTMDTSYNWYAKESNGPLVSAGITNGAITDISYNIVEGEVVLVPDANFNSSDLGGGMVAFTDQSSNDPLTWAWDFGDGNTSNAQNPQHTYAMAGDYTVCLTVTNDAGSDMICNSVTITFAPTASFSAANQGGGVVNFTDESTNNPTSWLWDLGDGNTSSEQNPQHQYAAPGTYTVCLTAANDQGSDMTCMMVTIVLAPMASYSLFEESIGTFAFTDESSNDPTSWLWDFGDGNTSTEENPQHTYTTPGVYIICLTVTNSEGSDMLCSELEVVLPPLSAFTFNEVGAGTFDFTDQSTNDPLTWDWDFGDGNTSTLQNPQHMFTSPGNYTVCLTVTNGAGSDMICTPLEVVFAPLAAFLANDMGDGIVDFTDQSTNDPTSWLWDFGDGTTSTDQNPQHTFTANGTYNVCLTVENSAGTNTTCEMITVIVFTSTDHLVSELNISITPNPVWHNLYIQLSNDQQEVLDFELLNTLGQVVMTKTITSNGQYVLSMENLASEIYYYTVKDRSGQLKKQGKIIKQ